MSDDEDYNSEEDLDYVPSEGEQASEEENSGDEEDLSLLKDDDTDTKETSQKKKVKSKKTQIQARRRKGGIKLEDKGAEKTKDSQDVEENEEELKRRKELAEQIALEEENRKLEKEKKRADDLWSSFMTGVKQPPRPAGSSSSQVPTRVCEGEIKSSKSEETGKTGKVTITKIFDFAGEEIKITKEVDADSKEAKAEQKKLEKLTQDQQAQVAGSDQPAPVSLGAGVKRPVVGGLGSVLNKINKKSKMGTLEKSKIDWDSFKRKEGIDEDLKIYNKGKQGYTERMAFLNRADQRQFEIERDLRLATSSKR